ncbi:MAG: hypothetical protein ACP5OG_02955 [Candidatus Nanoarchaeia archaeon]
MKATQTLVEYGSLAGIAEEVIMQNNLENCYNVLDDLSLFESKTLGFSKTRYNAYKSLINIIKEKINTKIKELEII